MIDKPKKTGLNCEICGYQLLALEDKVFCPNGRCPAKHSGNFRQIKPKGIQ